MNTLSKVNTQTITPTHPLPDSLPPSLPHSLTHSSDHPPTTGAGASICSCRCLGHAPALTSGNQFQIGKHSGWHLGWHAHTRTEARTEARTRARTEARTHAHTHTHTHTHTQRQAPMHAGGRGVAVIVRTDLFGASERPVSKPALPLCKGGRDSESVSI